MGRGRDDTPAEYERMKDTFVSQGWSYREAQKKAAKIYNYRRQRGEKPVGRWAEDGRRKTEDRGQRTEVGITNNE